MRSLTWLAIRARDEANTAWLKAEVAAHGWPTIPKVGKAAAANAWLMVQHADDDPPFQLAMLRLMEPLATRGEVARDNHALLYDRVMLKIVGTQRYGTQWSCESGRWAPSPLEDAKTVDTWRRSAGMGIRSRFVQCCMQRGERGVRSRGRRNSRHSRSPRPRRWVLRYA